MCLGANYWAKIKKVYFANTNVEASKVGFDDSFIFEEFKKKVEERKIGFLNISDPRAMEVLEEWKSQNHAGAQPWNDGHSKDRFILK